MKKKESGQDEHKEFQTVTHTHTQVKISSTHAAQMAAIKAALPSLCATYSDDLFEL